MLGFPRAPYLNLCFFLLTLMILLITFLCFADDTSLYLVVDNEYEAADQLNKDNESIHQWSQKWLINFNPDKTEIMTIYKKHHKPHHPPVYMGNVIIKEVQTHKHLGLTISEDGNRNEHVKSAITFICIP